MGIFAYDWFLATARKSAGRFASWRRPFIGVLVLLFAWMLPPNAHPQKPTEYQVKATYLYNFARFTQWPSETTAARENSVFICILGQDPFGPILDDVLSGETLEGKDVRSKRISTLQEAPSCRILFISSSEERQLKEILQGLEKAGLLTVSDIPNFARRGGMIQFIAEGNRIRFEVNLTSTEAGGLSLSSELLKVAIAVRR